MRWPRRRYRLTVIGLLLLTPTAIGQAAPLTLYGLCFGPYVEGNSPGGGVTQQEIDRLLDIIADSGFTQRIRTYGADDGLELIPQAAHLKGFSDVTMGTWIKGWDPNDPLSNPQIQELIAQAKAGWVQTGVIGNEGIYGGYFTPGDMVKFVSAVKGEIPIPVVTPEPFDVWFDGDASGAAVKPTMEALVREVDEVFVCIYPFHRDTPIDDAIGQLESLYDAAVSAVHAVAPGKRVVIAETGWPSAGGDANTPETSPENAEKYLLGVANWSNGEGIRVYYFEAFDEAWKAPPEYEAHWGILPVVVPLHPGDANNDGAVNVGDLGILAGNWGQSPRTWAQGNFTTPDTVVDVGDLGVLAGNWGWTAPPSLPAPEPASLMLLSLGGLVLLRRKRK